MFYRKTHAVIHTKEWKEFVVEFPGLFNEVFKSFAYTFDGKLGKHYEKIDYYIKVKTWREPKSELSRDFGYLYKDMVLSDVELEVGGKVLKAHKVILMSRSSVFKAMFSHDTLEAAKNRVVINDFDFQTIQELLRYIYCEKVENLETVAFDLLAAADYVSLQNISIDT